MSAIVEQREIITEDWRGLYREGWKGLITEAAFAHPAKFSRALIRRIYDHALEMNWLRAGDSVIDPFGGVALGGFDAMRHGLHWTGVELEPRFISLANGMDCDNSQCPDCQQAKEPEHQDKLFTSAITHRYQGNLDLWRAMRLPGTARLIQGDSRQLSEVISSACLSVSSPPYANDTVHGRPSAKDKEYFAGRTIGEHGLAGYSSDPANLGNLRATDTGLAAAISSPPYAASLHTNESREAEVERLRNRGLEQNIQKSNGVSRAAQQGYGETEGQLAAMKEGDLRAVISSPPFAESLASDDPDKRGGLFRDEKRKNDKTLTATYGTEPGNLGLMKASVSSPPMMDSLSKGVVKGLVHGSQGKVYKDTKGLRTRGGDRNSDRAKVDRETLNQTLNLGAINVSGNNGKIIADDFWNAARLILEQLHQVLSTDAVAIWVTKGFIRNKALVDFPDQWRRLCESVGFETLHIHRCWLVERHGHQHTLSGDVEAIETHRKSFFRRLHEKKYPDLSVDYETVLCMKRI